MKNLLETLEKSLSASEKTIAALMLHTYCVLNKEFKLVESRSKRTQLYHDHIDDYCKDKCGDSESADRNSMMARLNVGGKVHIIKRSSMLLKGDHVNFLHLMTLGRWDYLLTRDRNGVIFIDLDPALVTPILDKLRFRSNYGTTRQLIPRVSIDRRAIFDNVVSYYRMGDIIHGSTALSEESKIECMNDPKNILLLSSFLPSDLTEMRLRFELLYRGSRDGMTAAAFHRLCDGMDDTISVIKDTNGNVFGGFADKAWSTKSSWVKSEESFLFSLKSSLGKEVIKFPINTGDSYSLYHEASNMCAFGNGDLHVLPGQISVNIGTSYQNPSTAYSRQYCTGGYKTCQPHDIEVYQIIQVGLKAPVDFNANDLPISLTSLTKTEQSPLEAVSESIEVSNVYTTQTNDLSSNLLYVAQLAQMAEEELLLELLWIEHLSVPMSKRNISSGLLAEWQKICKESADVLPLLNGAVAARGTGTQKMVEESMARLGIKVGSKMKRDSTEGKVKSVMSDKVTMAKDDVISFNVGGTIIAVLRSTLLRQAPNSTFAASYSDRWVQQSDELDEFGNIYMVKEHMISFHLHRVYHLSLLLLAFLIAFFTSSLFLFVLLCLLLSFIAKTSL